MGTGYEDIENIIKTHSMKKIEEVYKKDIEHNEVLYKVIYHHLTLGSSIKLIKLLYGEIGIIILIKILNDNTIPIPKDLGKELYSNTDDYIKTKKEEKKLEDFFKLLLVVIVILLIIKNFF
ncbi:MAG: hypothetical protein ACLUBL_01510 [Fusobacterium sp.]|uniref:hypothetical protein n=2 Tax=Fusobacterium sp. TaxID=68766 RepID=UPI0039952D0B